MACHNFLFEEHYKWTLVCYIDTFEDRSKKTRRRRKFLMYYCFPLSFKLLFIILLMLIKRIINFSFQEENILPLFFSFLRSLCSKSIFWQHFVHFFVYNPFCVVLFPLFCTYLFTLPTRIYSHLSLDYFTVILTNVTFFFSIVFFMAILFPLGRLWN